MTDPIYTRLAQNPMHMKLFQPVELALLTIAAEMQKLEEERAH